MSGPHHVTPLVGCAATAIGGALGALARWGLESAFPTGHGGFPWVTFLINVAGSALLAALPLLPVVRRHAWAGVLLGAGVLGGFTTMSTASVDTFTLLDGGHVALGSAYCLGTVGAALSAVLLVSRWTSAEQQQAAMDEEWDE
jgi:CrcB protein